MRPIDADACIKAINDKYDAVHETRIRGASYPSISWDSGMSSALSIVESQPTIDAEPVRYGEWILWDGKYDSGYCICSRCKRPTGVVEAFQTYKYCPFCGAKMQARCKLDAS